MKLKDSNDNWAEDEGQVQGVIIDYFENIFASTTVHGSLSQREDIKKVTEEQNRELMQGVTAAEVKETIFFHAPGQVFGP